jgi:aldose 1-epimerase
VSLAPSGEQFEIAHGEQRATVVEVGGGIREYWDGDRPVLHPYALSAICDGAHGAPLIPWPNRLGDGRYTFDGQERQVALTEPAKQNAIHGLLRWRNWRALQIEADRVVMGTTLYPNDRWPFALRLEIEYRLGQAGLSVETRATNIGDGACPYACGQHPYLSPGEGQTVDECSLELPAATRILTDPERQLPTGREAVEGTEFDFRSSRSLASLQMDYAFTDLARDSDGRVWVSLARPDGVTASLWVDGAYPVIEVYTADTLAPERRRRGVAVEPMSAPPNALQTGESVVRLEPGEGHTARWGVGLS